VLRRVVRHKWPVLAMTDVNNRELSVCGREPIAIQIGKIRNEERKRSVRQDIQKEKTVLRDSSPGKG